MYEIEYPNIFDFASKELTQDAIVCWFLECAAKGIKIGNEFLKKLIFDKVDIDFDENNYEFECKAKKQCNRIDVYTCIKIGDKHYPVIFENKINTSLHDDQLKNYCTMVRDWFTPKKQKKENKDCDTIIYVYFKTGYVFDKEIDFINSEIEKLNSYSSEIKIKSDILGLDDIIDFLSNEPEKPELIHFYLEHCKIRREQQEKYRIEWDKKYNNDSLCTHIGQVYFFQEAFRDENEYITAYSGNTEYSYLNIYQCNLSGNEKAYTLCYRFEPRYKDINGEWIPTTYLKIQLYRDDSSYDSEYNWFEICENIVKKSTDKLKEIYSDIKCDFDSRKTRKHSYRGAEIMRITFNQSDENIIYNTPARVAEYIRTLKYEIEKNKEEFPEVIFQ